MKKISSIIEDINNTNKYSRKDSEYLSKRKVFSENIGAPEIYDYVDQFGLYVGEQTLGNKIFAYEAFKKTLNVPGHIAEFGVWHGSNLMYLAKLLQLLQPGSHKKVFGFDNFSGLPDAAEVDGEKAKSTTGDYKGNEQVLRAAIDLFGYDEWVHLIPGDANSTIPAFEAQKPETLISFAWIDFDLYEPCAVALDFLSRRLSVGGIIVFDEAIFSMWPGETLAMLEFLEKSPHKFSMVGNTISRQPTMYLIREQ